VLLGESNALGTQVDETGLDAHQRNERCEGQREPRAEFDGRHRSVRRAGEHSF